MGIEFDILPQSSILDGIENVWTHFNKFWIDANKCKSLIDALENYKRHWDKQKNMYLPKPMHPHWANHYADALRYLCMALPRTKRGLSSEEFELEKARALYGESHLPSMFRFNSKYDRYRR